MPLRVLNRPAKSLEMLFEAVQAALQDLWILGQQLPDLLGFSPLLFQGLLLQSMSESIFSR
jgi:hypothetical protein